MASKTLIGQYGDCAKEIGNILKSGMTPYMNEIISLQKAIKQLIEQQPMIDEAKQVMLEVNHWNNDQNYELNQAIEDEFNIIQNCYENYMTNEKLYGMTGHYVMMTAPIHDCYEEFDTIAAKIHQEINNILAIDERLPADEILALLPAIKNQIKDRIAYMGRRLQDAKDIIEKTIDPNATEPTLDLAPTIKKHDNQLLYHSKRQQWMDIQEPDDFKPKIEKLEDLTNRFAQLFI